ncbi:hypothetical protein [Sphingobacterium hotanense]|uniref:Uncharacterized protein n=1 Tax=Sphingobacterium hotanense TaxID=649196 RepID=A0ABT7NQ27_9SPHI|nr:hypothetical protein [Sphingobacterium hotanense]MDM1049353.1 hypothetical protein [Sphingobacterium hotanense]
MAGKISKQKAIELILVELDKGSTFSACMALNGTNWHIPERTFKRYWKEANQTYSERQQAIQSLVNEQRVELEKERVKSNILTKEQRMEIASQIAVDVEASNSDKIKAMDYLSKIDGDYAAIKQDVNINGSITPENWLMLQDKK